MIAKNVVAKRARRFATNLEIRSTARDRARAERARAKASHQHTMQQLHHYCTPIQLQHDSHRPRCDSRNLRAKPVALCAAWISAMLESNSTIDEFVGCVEFRIESALALDFRPAKNGEANERRKRFIIEIHFFKNEEE
jgi:hypothetical protein